MGWFLCCFGGDAQAVGQPVKAQVPPPAVHEHVADEKGHYNGSKAEPSPTADDQGGWGQSWARLNPSELNAVQHTLLKVTEGASYYFDLRQLALGGFDAALLARGWPSCFAT
jgi:hypothetical protein